MELIYALLLLLSSIYPDESKERQGFCRPMFEKVCIEDKRKTTQIFIKRVNVFMYMYLLIKLDMKLLSLLIKGKSEKIKRGSYNIHEFY